VNWRKRWRAIDRRSTAARRHRANLEQLERELGPVPADTPEQAAERLELERQAAELPDEDEP